MATSKWRGTVVAKKVSLAQMMRDVARRPSGSRSWHETLEPQALAEVHDAIAELGRMINSGANVSYAQAARLIIEQLRIKVRPETVAEYISRRLNGKR
jgi:hypothetical protein